MFKDYDDYFKLIEKNLLSLEKVPKKFKNEDMCLEAIKNSDTEFKYINDDLKGNIDFYNKACETNGYILQYIPKDFRTEDLCLKAFNSNKNSFRYIPKEYKTKDMCFKAVSYNASLLQNVPSKFQNDKELYIQASKQNVYSMLYEVPEYFEKDFYKEIIESIENPFLIYKNADDGKPLHPKHVVENYKEALLDYLETTNFSLVYNIDKLRRVDDISISKFFYSRFQEYDNKSLEIISLDKVFDKDFSLNK